MREPFDRERTFIAVRRMTIQGKRIESGDPFDKSLVNVRRLRQMYDTRWIKMAPDNQLEPKPPVFVMPTKPEFLKLSNEGLRIWLKGHRVLPRPRATRVKLLELVEKKWQEYIDDLKSHISNGQAGAPTSAL